MRARTFWRKFATIAADFTQEVPTIGQRNRNKARRIVKRVMQRQDRVAAKARREWEKSYPDDTNCITTADGDCVSTKPCMHTNKIVTHINGHEVLPTPLDKLHYSAENPLVINSVAYTMDAEGKPVLVRVETNQGPQLLKVHEVEVLIREWEDKNVAKPKMLADDPLYRREVLGRWPEGESVEPEEMTSRRVVPESELRDIQQEAGQLTPEQMAATVDFICNPPPEFMDAQELVQEILLDTPEQVIQAAQEFVELHLEVQQESFEKVFGGATRDQLRKAFSHAGIKGFRNAKRQEFLDHMEGHWTLQQRDAVYEYLIGETK